MKRILSTLAVAVLGLAAFALVSPRAIAADADLRLADRIQIEDLMWKYARALDSNNAEAYAAVYTADGQFGTGPTATKGREALKKMIADLKQRNAEADAKSKQKRPQMYHMATNHTVEFIDKDHARYLAYWITVVEGQGQEVPARFAAAGREIDELVRVNGQWLIKVRDTQPKGE
jgi:uncharacterized protein (TIGR02246 family)